jgi:uncharacterized protein YdaU (DUF1376 family)
MPRRTPPSFDFYPDDFVGGTYYMDGEALAMYIRSICFQWGNDVLPDDAVRLAKIMNVSDEVFAKYWPQVAEKFISDGNGGLYNARLKSEKDKRLGIASKRSAAGRKGGQASAKHLLISAQAIAKQTSSKGKTVVGSRKTVVGSGETDDGSGEPTLFDLFWATVPNKIGKRDAAKAFDRSLVVVATEKGLGKTEAAGFITERMASFAESPKAKGEFCPHPATWLNGGRYDDDPEQWVERVAAGQSKPRESTRI